MCHSRLGLMHWQLPLLGRAPVLLFHRGCLPRHLAGLQRHMPAVAKAPLHLHMLADLFQCISSFRSLKFARLTSPLQRTPGAYLATHLWMHMAELWVCLVQSSLDTASERFTPSGLGLQNLRHF